MPKKEWNIKQKFSVVFGKSNGEYAVLIRYAVYHREGRVLCATDKVCRSVSHMGGDVCLSRRKAVFCVFAAA